VVKNRLTRALKNKLNQYDIDIDIFKYTIEQILIDMKVNVYPDITLDNWTNDCRELVTLDSSTNKKKGGIEPVGITVILVLCVGYVLGTMILSTSPMGGWAIIWPLIAATFAVYAVLGGATLAVALPVAVMVDEVSHRYDS